MSQSNESIDVENQFLWAQTYVIFQTFSHLINLHIRSRQGRGSFLLHLGTYLPEHGVTLWII
jgi:hypothetical protein